MTGITSLKRITGSNNSTVQLYTTDTTAVALSANYITAQAANILLVTEGGWKWKRDDVIVVSASDGVSVAAINSTFTSFISIASQSVLFAIKTSTFSLTNAQWTSMSTTPVLVLPGQGVGTAIIPSLITIELIFGTVVLASGGSVFFIYDLASPLLATNTQNPADFYATANDLYNFRLSVANTSQMAISRINNSPLYITNLAPNFTGGAGNTYSGRIYYRTITIV